MKEFLISKLADPYSGEELMFSPQNNCLENAGGETYFVKDDIAVMINAASRSTNHQTSLHNNFDSNFNYLAHYETDATQFDYFKDDESRTTKQERKRSRQAIIDAVPKKAFSILDIGCGSGWVAEHFLKKGKQIISSDISITNPLKVLAKFPHKNHAGIVCDAFNLPFKNNTFDCIIASEVIEHVFDPSVFVRSLLQKLKSGGTLILVTPYNEKIEYFLCVHCNRPTPKNAHLHSFDEEKIKVIFKPFASKTSTKVYCNKYLLKLRLYNLLSFLPFGLWNVLDNLSNKFVKKPTTFLIKSIKD